ncbi:UNVERIFIED_CONTAM: hypothetical protein FKN15_061142 [Acipenser sinensis]
MFLTVNAIIVSSNYSYGIPELSIVDCPPDLGDFRAQQCSAHIDVRYQGQYYEWLPLYNDPENPCALKCKAKGTSLVVELAPKVLDGTRCYTESLDMCISGTCQIVGCDHELGSTAKEDNCGVCNGDGSTCRLVRGQYKSQLSTSKMEDTVIAIPYGSRHVRLVLKGPDHLRYQLTSAECFDLRSGRVVADQYCHYYPENVKPKPKLRECNMDPCPASSTCGIGNQRRRVKCQVLLSFSQTVADLPDDECEGPKPPASRPCYSRPCRGEREDHSPEEQDKVQLFQLDDDDDELHDWEYEGFTECSESCGGGLQEAVVICLNEQTREVVEESFCVSHRRPPQLLKACSMEPCPPRWETGKWSSCSSTCGVGLRTRDVTCTHLLSRESNETVTLSGEKCRPAKPTQVQACNRFDCPSAWYPQDWQQCSRSCGGGVQTREILCKQRLADGSFLELPETFCSPPNPITQQPCENRACPAEWGALEWSQCSASCGEGIQVLPVVCRKMDENGQYVTLDSSSCSNLLQPSSVRPCSLASCARSLNLGQKLAPHIITSRKVYMQLRKERKLQFVMGGYAYLKPKTSIVLRCPVRRFRKSLINWEKDGMPLTSLPHLTVTPYGYIKIHHLKPSDIGTYTCVAGPMRESFIVKLIGGNHKLIAPPSAAKIKKSKDKPWLISNGRTITESLGNDKTWVFRDHFSQYDNIVLRLLEMKGLARESPDSWELQESSERNISFSEEDHSLEATAPLTMVAEQRRLDEIIKNLSAQPEELRGNYADHLLTQLLAEVTKSQAESNESTMRHHEKDDSTSLESLIHKSNPGTPITPHRDLSSSSESMGHPRQHLRAPLIVKKTHAHLKPHLSSPEVVVHVGHTVLLRSWINLLVVKCEAVGNPEPTISWSKNGEQLKASSRVGMLPDGSLQIFSPSETDVGFYTCTARNSIGATALSSTITLTDQREDAPPLSVSISTDCLEVELLKEQGLSDQVINILSSKKPSTFQAYTGKWREFVHWCISKSLHHTAISLCIPKSKISWTVVNGKSVPNHYQSKDGSLLIVNASLLDQGQYTCQAANPYGQVTEVTQLLLLAMYLLPLESGCPVKGHPRPHISWFLNSQPLGSAAETTHQLLAEGQVLRLPNVTKHLHGEVRCLSENDAGTLQQRADLDIRDYEWRVDDLMPCSAPCGNKGTQYPRLKCLWDSLEVNRSLCRDKPKPALKPVPCNIKDCLPRWLVTPWSPCSQSCGGGMLSRKVTCNKVTAAGISVTLIEVSCTPAGKRPADMQPCNTLPCVEWATSTWAQCNGQCIGLKQATQHRQVFCQAKNGTVMTFNQCSSVPRPPSTRSCTSEACNVQWHVGSWTQCTATCGNYGFQSRRVECVHLQSGKAGREQFCSWRQRPANWQRCNILPCEKLECRDTTRHCEKVKQLKLCQLSQFKVRCCCPVKGHPRPHISWFLNSQPLGSAAETTHQLLAEGQVLRLPNVTKHLHGEVRCLSENDAGTLQQRADLDIRDYEWRVDDLMPCSAPCGNKGTQYPRLKCLWDSLEVNRSLCRDKPKPALKPVPCNIKDCLPRPPSTRSCTSEACNVQWHVGSWTQCTATCGNYGFQSRRVECVHLQSGKAGREQFCSWRQRPANWQRCNILPCEKLECRDTTRHCEKVKQLKLCQLSQFKVRCCESCKDT